jgi:hypothetical protein
MEHRNMPKTIELPSRKQAEEDVRNVTFTPSFDQLVADLATLTGPVGLVRGEDWTADWKIAHKANAKRPTTVGKVIAESLVDRMVNGELIPGLLSQYGLTGVRTAPPAAQSDDIVALIVETPENVRVAVMEKAEKALAQANGEITPTTVKIN